MNYLPAILESNRRVIKRFGKEIWIKSDSKNSKNVTLTTAKMIAAVTWHLSTNSVGEKRFCCQKSVLSIFSTDSWTNLEQVKKDKHSPTDCEWCLKNPIYKNTLSKLPIKTNAYRRKAFLHDLDGKTSAVLQNVTNEIVSDLNSDFKSRFNVNFMSQVATSTKSSNIEKENTTRTIKKDIEAKCKQKSVET